MPLATLKDLLLICTLINFSLVTLWFALFYYAHDWLYRLHGRWFQLTPQRFDELNYLGIAFYKILAWMFNLAPLIALSLLR